MLQQGGRRRRRRGTRRPRRQRSHRRVLRHRRTFRRRKTRRHRGGSPVRRTRAHRGGGDCGARGLTKAWQSGASSPVGGAWKSTPSSWPGEAGSLNGATVSNHYGLSTCGAGPGGVQPYFGMSSATGAAAYGGGKRRRGRKQTQRRGRKHAQRGGLGFSFLGDLLPQPVVNAWRDATGKVWGAGYGYAGLKAPASNNSDPTHQPIDKNYEYIGGIPPDVPSINQFAGEAVAQLSTN